MQYITYKINDEQEVKIDANPNDNTIIIVDIQLDQVKINIGENPITIIAVDVSNNETTKEDVIKGTAEPIIEVVGADNALKCKISHPTGFEKIIFNLNGTEYVYDKNSPQYVEDNPVFEIKIPMQTGENKLIIEAYSNEGTTKTYKGKVTF